MSSQGPFLDKRNMRRSFAAAALLVTASTLTACGGIEQTQLRYKLAQEDGNDKRLCLDGNGRTSWFNDDYGVYLKGTASGVLNAAESFRHGIGNYPPVSIYVEGIIGHINVKASSNDYETSIHYLNNPYGSQVTVSTLQKVVNEMRKKITYRAHNGRFDANGSCAYKVSQKVSLGPILG